MRASRILVLLLALASGASAQSGWDRYQPGSMQAIIARESPVIEQDTLAAPRFFVTAQTFPRYSTVIFLGKVRPIAADHRQILTMWARSVRMDTTRVLEYEEEWLVREDTLQLWLPVQAATASSMRGVVKSGDSLTVWVQWFGGVRRNNRTSWVFPVMRTQSY